jgi:HJR/Mrr/RecB family endonuclease
MGYFFTGLIIVVIIILVLVFFLKIKKKKENNIISDEKKIIPEAMKEEMPEDKIPANSKYYFDENLSEEEYKKFCSKILQENGWEVTSKQSSENQEVDLIAVKEGVSISIKCKKVITNIDQDLIHRLFTNYKRFLTKYAVVVTNTDHTNSSKDSASSHNVLILKQNELEGLYDKLKDKSYF